MPLAFESLSNGTFAFGFFNVRSDMLLLENRFFFATDFCGWMTDLASSGADELAATWEIWTIDRPEDVGDLHGAIRGTRFTGFIGETYRHYPFPSEPGGFKQAPEGDGTQAEIAAMIARYARRGPIAFSASRGRGPVSVGDLEVADDVFRDLVRYVWRGGYPRWRDEQRPPYVVAMGVALEKSASWLLHGIDWEV